MTPRTRQCPVDAACAPVRGWEAFLDHIYEQHTEGARDDRMEQVQRLLERGRMECPPPPHTVVPKVTADPRTHALWALAGGNAARARQIVATMGISERRAFLALMTELINMLWGELG